MSLSAINYPQQNNSAFIVQKKWPKTAAFHFMSLEHATSSQPSHCYYHAKLVVKLGNFKAQPLLYVIWLISCYHINRESRQKSQQSKLGPPEVSVNQTTSLSPKKTFTVCICKSGHKFLEDTGGGSIMHPSNCTQL